MLTLYDYYRSSASYRVRIALNLKQLDFDSVPIHLINQGGEQFSEKYRAINPQCLVPTLKDRDKTISQSLAIIEYLEETHPSPALLPKDFYQRALVREFALMIAADIHPLNNLRVLNYLTHETNLAEDKKQQWYKHWIALGLSALEQKLQKHQLHGDYCFGKQPTLADICLIPQLYNAKRFACDLSPYPTLVRIDAHCLKQTAFKNATPEEVMA